MGWRKTEFSPQSVNGDLGKGNWEGGTELNKKKWKDFLLFALFVFPAVAFVLFATDNPFIKNLDYYVFDFVQFFFEYS